MFCCRENYIVQDLLCLFIVWCLPVKHYNLDTLDKLRSCYNRRIKLLLFLVLNVEIVSLTSWWMLVYLALIQYFIMLLPHSHSCRCVLVQITLLCICVTFSFRCECVFTVFYCIYTAYSVYSCLSSVIFYIMGRVAWFKINDDDDSAVRP